MGSMRLTLLLLAVLLPAAARADDPPVAEGMWRAWLEYPDHEVPFELEIVYTAGQLQAWIRNGPERIPFQRIELQGPRLTLGLDHYGGVISVLASTNGRALSGTYERARRDGRGHVLPLRARHGEPRFSPPTDTPPNAVKDGSIDGHYALFQEGNEPEWIMDLETQPDGSVLGNTARLAGDLRYLVGTFEGGRLRLSTFDGAHSVLYDGILKPNGELVGERWFGTRRSKWTAVRDTDAKLPDPFKLVTWVEGTELEDLRFKDLTAGKTLSLADPALAGKARLVYLLGTWCPNCTDQTQYMVELQERYKGRGLSIVGLSYEGTQSETTIKALLDQYAKRHEVTYPLLFAGQASARGFPGIRQLVAYPTTVFLHRDGRVRAIHSGFNGPAAGERHARLRAAFEGLIEELLAEGS